MKKNITISFFLLCYIHLNSQIYAGGEPLSEIFDGKYITVCPFNKSAGNYNARIDFGQETSRRLGTNRSFITEENGNRKSFNSKTGIINFMDKNGFDIFHISDSTNCIIYRRKE